MKKFYYRLLLLVVVLAGVMPFIMKGDDGRPLMKWADVRLPDLSVPGLVGEKKQEGVAAVYRWQDDQGTWHFSDSSNPKGRSELVNVQFNTSVAPPDVIESNESRTPAGSVEKILKPGFIPILHAGEALKQARNVESLLQQRFQRQEQAF